MQEDKKHWIRMKAQAKISRSLFSHLRRCELQIINGHVCKEEDKRQL